MEPITKDFLIEFFTTQFSTFRSEIRVEIKSDMQELEIRLETKLETKLKKMIEDQGAEYQRYIGIISEDFQSRLSFIAEHLVHVMDDIAEMKVELGMKANKDYVMRADFMLGDRVDKLENKLVEKGVLSV